MLMDRIIGAFTFRKEVYAEVEKDQAFTTTAWILVIVVAFLNQLGSSASPSLAVWAIETVLGTIGAVIAFAVATFVVQLVGRIVFSADVTYGEMVRTLGLAYVWQVIGLIGVVTAFSEALSCLLTPAILVAWILALIAWLIAAKEALDLEWVPTIVTVIIGWIVLAAITFAFGVAGWVLFVIILEVVGAALGGFLS
jgi:hypothetical protein